MGCFDLIEDRLQKHNFDCKRIDYLNVENLYATYGDKGKLFCFLVHTDVVPTGPEEKWTHPPFSGHIEGNMMYGRGTADMKGSIAAFLDSLDEFFKEKIGLNYRIAILLTSNEEGKKSDGFIDKIVEDMIANNDEIDFCLVGEPTSYKANGPEALKIEVDLGAQELRVGDETISFDVDPFRKHCLLEGLDDIGLTLQNVDDIKTYEEKAKQNTPWLFN